MFDRHGHKWPTRRTPRRAVRSGMVHGWQKLIELIRNVTPQQRAHYGEGPCKVVPQGETRRPHCSIVPVRSKRYTAGVEGRFQPFERVDSLASGTYKAFPPDRTASHLATYGFASLSATLAGATPAMDDVQFLDVGIDR
jgi:hypothetical protein